jgi:predicted CoA-binding protein
VTAEDDKILRMLHESRVIAVVGASPDPARDSHGVMAYLQRHGYRTIPVNPACREPEILGEKVWPRLSDVPERIDLVDVFRRSEHAGAVVDEAVEAGARFVWLQLGVIDESAAARAEAAGVPVVMNRCPRIEIPRLLEPQAIDQPAPGPAD